MLSFDRGDLKERRLMFELELMNIRRQGIEAFEDAFERLEIGIERLHRRAERCELINGGGDSANQMGETIAEKDQFLLVDLDLIFGLDELEEKRTIRRDEKQRVTRTCSFCSCCRYSFVCSCSSFRARNSFSVC